MATWSEKRKMYLTAYLIYNDLGAPANPGGGRATAGMAGGIRDAMNWALDVRGCAISQHNLFMLDEYYTPGGSGYVRVPNHLRPILRLFWRNMRQRRLIRQGERIVNACYEDGYEFS